MFVLSYRAQLGQVLTTHAVLPYLSLVLVIMNTFFEPSNHIRRKHVVEQGVDPAGGQGKGVGEFKMMPPGLLHRIPAKYRKQTHNDMRKNC